MSKLLCSVLIATAFTGVSLEAKATTFTETVPNGNGPIPNTYPPVGGTMFVLIGANGNIYYQFVNPSTQFQGLQLQGTPTAFLGSPKFQLGPTQTLNCGTVSCAAYFGGSIVEGYSRLTVRDADGCDASTGSSGGNDNFDYQDIFFEVNGIRVSSLSDLPANSVERTNFSGTSAIGTENCFRNQNGSETSTSWFDLTSVPGLLNDILSTGATTPFIHDNDGWNNGRGDNFWFFTDGNDASGTPEVAPGARLTKTANKTSYAAINELIEYSFFVENIGSVTLTNIVVTDPFITGTISCPQTTLASGANMTCTAQHIVSQANIDDDIVFVNEASVTAVPTEGTLGAVSGQITISGPAATNTMTLTKTASKDTDVEEGDIITYTYVATNTGNITIDAVTISDVHGGTAALSAITPSNVTIAPNGGSQTFTSTYTVKQADIDAGSVISNTATANGTPRRGPFTPPEVTETITPIAPNPLATLTKTASPDANAGLNDVITYNYVVENTGNVTLNNIMISDVHGGTGTLGAITPASVATLAPGDSTTFTSMYTITQEDVDAGTPISNTATANASPASGNYTAPEAVEEVTLEAPVPSVEFTKTASDTTDVTVGQVITYTYNVRNTGNVLLTGVSITDAHNGDGPLGTISPASVASLPVGQTAIFTADYTVTQADIDAAADITNIATVTATPSRGSLPTTTAQEAVDVADPVPALTMVKTATTTDFDTVGDIISYTYRVTNAGNISISAISVTDNKIATVNCPATSIAPMEFVTCTADYSIKQEDLDAGFVTNVAEATGTPTDGTPPTVTATETINGTQSPKLTLVKTALDTNFTAIGDTIDYEYLVTNTGNVDIMALSVTDDKIATLNCPVTALAPMEQTTCTGTYTVIQEDLDAGQVINNAEASGTPAGGILTAAGAQETVSGTQNPQLTLEKTALTTDFSAVGDILDYSYKVTNTGNVTLTNAVSVDDDKITIPAIVSCPSLPAGGLAPNAFITCTASYMVTQADLDAGFVTNIASATHGTTISPTDQATVTATQNPAMTLLKEPVETSYAAVGDMISYNYTVMNTGNVLIANLSVTDDLISSVTCNVTSVGNGDANLDPNEVVVCTGIYQVTQADLDNGFVTNNAEATGTPPGGTLTPPRTDATVNADQQPALTMIKTAGESSFDAVGDILNYEYEVENTGNVFVSSIAVMDDKISTVTCNVAAIGNNDANLDPNETVICTAQYTVTQDDLDAGSVTNNATATGAPAGGMLTNATADETVNADQKPALETVKTATVINFELPGDITTYEYVVTNTGNVTLTDSITVSDNLISSVSCPPLPATGLAPLASITCTADYVVTQADLDNGSVTNLATAKSGTTTSPQSSETVPANQAPAMEIEKAALFTDFTAAGEIVEYEYTVRNTGNLTLTGGINIVDDKIGTINCVSGNLVPMGVQTCRATYTITQADLDAGQVTNQAFGQNGMLTSPPVDVTVAATQTSTLSFDKRATTTTFTMAGDILSYEFDVKNTGNVTLTGVAVNDDLIATVSCPKTTLVPEEDMVCTASYTVTQDDVDAGEVINNASASGNPPTGPPTSTPDSETVDSSAVPGLNFVKRALDTDFTMAGDILDFAFDLENTGTITLSNIVVTDDLISTVNCPLTSLAPSGTMTCTASYTVTQGDIDAGSVINNAAANAALPDGSAIPEETGTATVTGTQSPSLTVDKEATTTDFTMVGDTLDYTYTVRNTGNVNITAIMVVDDLIPALSCPATALAPNAEFECTGQYIVTQDDIDNGSVTNNVTVDGTPSGGILSPASDQVTVTGTQLPALEITKTATTTSFAAPGDTIDYEYRVRNTGNVTLTGSIMVADDKISAVACPSLPMAGLAPNAEIVCTATYVVTQADIDAGSVTNIATASNGGTTSPQATATVNADQMPELTTLKRAIETSFDMPTDTIDYEYDVINTGNITIVDPITVNDDKIASVTCPALPTDGLAPMAQITCTATYNVTQTDIDAGEVTNIATATAGGITSMPDEVTVEAMRMPQLAVTKTITEIIQVGGPIYDVTYQIMMENTGNITLTNLQLDDDLVSFLAPSVIYETPVVAVSGISGASYNTDYDGASDITLLSGTPSLAVGEAGLVTIIVRIDTTTGGPAQGNTAFGSSDALEEPVPSNDPNVTPSSSDDINPTPLSIIDTDGDGAPDNFESPTNDRDGDGIPDSEDYDPTGYFYCEENGQILPGGGISVSGPAGTNAAIGTANNIVIVEDGSNGFFQFFVTAPGRYTMTPTYPTTGVPSTARPVQNVALDATSLLPNNPAILGSSEVGNTGVVADASAAANTPFYFEFDFEAGDPAVLMNNIPLKHCGTPEITLNKTPLSAPEFLADGRQLVSYAFTAENTGETLIENVQISDDLGAVFGADRVEIDSLTIADGPVNYAGDTNRSYDGVTDTDLMSGTGSLKPGESLTLNLAAIVNPANDGDYINTATLSAFEPLNRNPLSGEGRATVSLLPLSDASFLRVTKSAQPRTVQIGDPVLYTISVTNESASTMSDLNIVDRLPEGFSYIPNTAVINDASHRLSVEPTITNRGVLNWSINQTELAPLDTLQPNETLSVSLRLLAGPNVKFGAHENQAYVESLRTGTRSEIATAIVDYIPEPSFDCTPIIGRVYDDVNHNGYPDDGEPGLPSVRLVTVNGDIITTDQYGRYHIPCAIIANSERGSNFLLKADTRTLPLGYSPTTENPRVIRATRGKFAKMNFGAAHRPKLRIDIFAADFDDSYQSLLPEAAKRVTAIVKQAPNAERAILVYHADDLENVDTAQDALRLSLKVVRELAPKQFKDIALEASWGDAAAFKAPGEDAKGTENLAIGQLFDAPASPENRDRVPFFEGDNGDIYRSDFDAEGGDDHFGTADRRGDRFQNREAGLRGDNRSGPLSSDMRPRGVPFAGRGDTGDIDSARPGRLLRWVGWGNNITAYSEGVEIETTTDSLDPVKRLNVQANIVSGEQGRVIRAQAYWNYDAFIERAELRVFDADRSTRSEPISVAAVSNGEATLSVNMNIARAERNRKPELLYVLRVYSWDGSFDETAPKTLRMGDAEFDLTEQEWLAESNTAFGQNTLLMSNIPVRGGSVRVYGRNVPGKSVTVMGLDVHVDETGKFVSEQLLPAGKQHIEITVDGINDTTKRILRSVDVKTRDTFYVGQIEATIGENITEDSSGKRDFQEGRLAFYVRSRLNDRWALTATADTGEAATENIFNGLDDKDLGQLLRRLDPDRYYPVYGDDSTIEQDAPTSGRIYARIERDDDYALWGNYQTNFNDTEFARVQRTLYGAKLHWDENGNPTKLGDDRTSLTAFIAEGGSRQGRDELRGTGGSVYYMRHGDISIGSEILRVETRDSVSGLVLETRRLVYGTDYDMDFIQGRVILNQPLRSTANDGRLFRDGSQSGNETVLVVDYEFTPVFGSSDDAAVYGARGSRWFGDHVKLGATYNHDTDGGAESDLYEIDLTLQYAAGTYIKGEFARTEGLGVQTFRSIDGGFTYNPQDRGGLADNTSADGYALEAAIDFKEVDGINLDGTSYAYWRKREAGFAGYSEATNQTIEQFGGGINLELHKDLTLSARADVSDDKTLGTNSFAEATLDYDVSDKITATAGVSFSDDRRGNSGTSLGGRVEYELDDESSVYAFGQVGLDGNNTRTTDRIGAGAELRLSKNILGGGEISTGEDGLGARASLRYQYEEGDEYYLAYDLPLRSQATSNLGTFNFGARRRYTDALSVYGEERFQFNDQGLNGIIHAYGLDFKPGNWNLGLSGELGRVDDLDREALSASVGFADERMKAGVTGEWREDEDVTTGDKRRTWLLRSTARYQASDELRLQGKLNMAFSDQERDSPLGPQDFNKAEFTEASISAAYRPIWDDRFNLLGKLVWLEDLSPTSQRFNGDTLNYRQKSSIASIDASYDVSAKFTLGGKYAHRAGSVTTNRDSLDFTKSQADLGVLRLDYHVTHRWDAVLEGRYLDIGNGVITRKGGLGGIYRHVNDNSKIGLGLTWGGIEEEYLATVGKENEIGWYLNVVGKF